MPNTARVLNVCFEREKNENIVSTCLNMPNVDSAPGCLDALKQFLLFGLFRRRPEKNEATVRTSIDKHVRTEAMKK